MALPNIESDETEIFQEYLNPTTQYFQHFVFTHTIDPDSLREAWEAYGDFTAARVSMYEQEKPDDPLVHDINLFHEAATQRLKVIHGANATKMDAINASLYKTLFVKETMGFEDPPGSEPGILLKGLMHDKPKLAKAVAFCKAMNELGLLPYPQS
jgi:hypothetical protein